MKLKRDVVGRMAEIVWRDPCRINLENKRLDLSDVPMGESMLPRQKERGVILAVREGIVAICHTETTDSPLKEDDTLHEYDCTFIPEDRIESLVLFAPEGTPNGT